MAFHLLTVELSAQAIPSRFMNAGTETMHTLPGACLRGDFCKTFVSLCCDGLHHFSPILFTAIAMDVK